MDHYTRPLRAARVSVLDLDNSVRFSRDIQNLARKHQITNLLSEDRTELRSRPYSARSNSVDCYFKIALKVTYISLNDVKSSKTGWQSQWLNDQVSKVMVEPSGIEPLTS